MIKKRHSKSIKPGRGILGSRSICNGLHVKFNAGDVEAGDVVLESTSCFVQIIKGQTKDSTQFKPSPVHQNGMFFPLKYHHKQAVTKGCTHTCKIDLQYEDRNMINVSMNLKVNARKNRKYGGKKILFSRPSKIIPKSSSNLKKKPKQKRQTLYCVASNETRVNNDYGLLTENTGTKDNLASAEQQKASTSGSNCSNPAFVPGLSLNAVSSYAAHRVNLQASKQNSFQKVQGQLSPTFVAEQISRNMHEKQLQLQQAAQYLQFQNQEISINSSKQRNSFGSSQSQVDQYNMQLDLDSIAQLLGARQAMAGQQAATQSRLIRQQKQQLEAEIINLAKSQVANSQSISSAFVDCKEQPTILNHQDTMQNLNTSRTSTTCLNQLQPSQIRGGVENAINSLLQQIQNENSSTDKSASQKIALGAGQYPSGYATLQQPSNDPSYSLAMQCPGHSQQSNTQISQLVQQLYAQNPKPIQPQLPAVTLQQPTRVLPSGNQLVSSIHAVKHNSMQQVGPQLQQPLQTNKVNASDDVNGLFNRFMEFSQGTQGRKATEGTSNTIVSHLNAILHGTQQSRESIIRNQGQNKRSIVGALNSATPQCSAGLKESAGQAQLGNGQSSLTQGNGLNAQLMAIAQQSAQNQLNQVIQTMPPQEPHLLQQAACIDNKPAANDTIQRLLCQIKGNDQATQQSYMQAQNISAAQQATQLQQALKQCQINFQNLKTPQQQTALPQPHTTVSSDLLKGQFDQLKRNLQPSLSSSLLNSNQVISQLLSQPQPSKPAAPTCHQSQTPLLPNPPPQQSSTTLNHPFSSSAQFKVNNIMQNMSIGQLLVPGLPPTAAGTQIPLVSAGIKKPAKKALPDLQTLKQLFGIKDNSFMGGSVHLGQVARVPQ